MPKHQTPWKPGAENARESQRFRWPVYGSENASFPWLALFETEEDAKLAAVRVNEFPGIIEENNRLRKRIEELEKLTRRTTAPKVEAGDGP